MYEIKFTKPQSQDYACISSSTDRTNLEKIKANVTKILALRAKLTIAQQNGEKNSTAINGSKLN